MFIKISASVAAVILLILLAICVGQLSALNSNLQQVKQEQIYTNDNLCNQQAYQGGTSCQGGDQNGGSLLP